MVDFSIISSGKIFLKSSFTKSRSSAANSTPRNYRKATLKNKLFSNYCKKKIGSLNIKFFSQSVIFTGFMAVMLKTLFKLFHRALAQKHLKFTKFFCLL